MRRISARLVASMLLAGSLAAAATEGHNRYRWHDAEGGLHYGDVLPPEAAKFGYDVLNAQGIVIRRVERAKTSAEREAAEALAQQAEEAREAAERERREDRQLLAAYPTEDDLARSHAAELGVLDQQLESLRSEVDAEERLLGEQLDAAAEYDRDKQPVPAKLADQISVLRKRVADHRDYIERRQAERAATVQRFAEELARYRSLRSAPAL
jgi:hypothetical protein